MEQEIDKLIFNMDSLGTKNKRGLSRYYSSKARSFTWITEARCVEDLKKPEHPDAKKRKKHSDRKELYGILTHPYEFLVQPIVPHLASEPRVQI